MFRIHVKVPCVGKKRREFINPRGGGVPPAWIVSHFHNLLFKGLGLSVRLIAQSLKVYPPVFLFMATTNAVCPYPSWMAERKMSNSLHLALVRTSSTAVIKANTSLNAVSPLPEAEHDY